MIEIDINGRPAGRVWEVLVGVAFWAGLAVFVVCEVVGWIAIAQWLT